MKPLVKNVSSLLLCSVALIASFTHESFARESEDSSASHKRHKKSCIKIIDSLPYIIRKAGTYELGCDLAFNPTEDNQTAITIASSDVVLDLTSFRLYQCQGNTRPTTGIFINPNISNISIVGNNGTIQGFQGWGINAPGPNDMPIGNIKLEGITVEGCGSDARIDAGPGTFAVFAFDGGINIGTINFGAFSPLPITRTQPISEVLISNVRVLRNKNIGLSVHTTENTIIQDTIIDGTFSEAPTYLVSGLNVTSAEQGDPNPRLKNVNITRTIISNTHCATLSGYAPGKLALGIGGAALQGIDNLIVTDTTVSQTVAGTSSSQPSGAIFCANWLQGGIVNCTFENCTFSEATGDQFTALVNNFHTSANSTFVGPAPGLQVTQNHMYKNIVTSGASGYYLATGFNAYYTQKLVVENCTSYGHTVKTGGLPPFYEGLIFVTGLTCAGFYIGGGVGSSLGDNQTQNSRGQSRQVVVKDCVSLGCTAQVGQASGFIFGGGPYLAFKSGYYGTCDQCTAGAGTTASQVGTTVTGVGTDWKSGGYPLVGGILLFENQQQAYIVSVDSDTQLTVLAPATVPSQPYFIRYQSTTPSDSINLKDISFINCVAQDITSAADMPGNATFGRPVIPGVAAGILVDRGVTQAGGTFGNTELTADPLAILKYKPAKSLENVYIKNARISNINSALASAGFPQSGGIVLLGVDKATVIDTSITGCNNDGILMSGGSYWLSPILTPSPITIDSTTNAIVQNTIVANSTNNGYHDTAGIGENAFVNNTAFNNGTDFNVGTDPNINPIIP